MSENNSIDVFTFYKDIVSLIRLELIAVNGVTTILGKCVG